MKNTFATMKIMCRPIADIHAVERHQLPVMHEPMPRTDIYKDILSAGQHASDIPSYYILEYPEWVNVIAITDEEQFVFVKQYRHGTRRVNF